MTLGNEVVAFPQAANVLFNPMLQKRHGLRGKLRGKSRVGDAFRVDSKQKPRGFPPRQ
jgi:hypothetical protein